MLAFAYFCKTLIVCRRIYSSSIPKIGVQGMRTIILPTIIFGRPYCFAVTKLARIKILTLLGHPVTAAMWCRYHQSHSFFPVSGLINQAFDFYSLSLASFRTPINSFYFVSIIRRIEHKVNKVNKPICLFCPFQSVFVNSLKLNSGNFFMLRNTICPYKVIENHM